MLALSSTILLCVGHKRELRSTCRLTPLTIIEATELATAQAQQRRIYTTYVAAALSAQVLSCYVLSCIFLGLVSQPGRRSRKMFFELKQLLCRMSYSAWNK